MMEIEKLIEQLNARGLSNGSSLGYHCGLYDEAATALSTLQAENSQLRAYLEYEREHADAYYEECGQGRAVRGAVRTYVPYGSDSRRYRRLLSKLRPKSFWRMAFI